MMTGCLRMFLYRVWKNEIKALFREQKKLYVDSGTTITPQSETSS